MAATTHSGVSTCQAAVLLGVHPQQLRLWEREFGLRSLPGVCGQRRSYDLDELIALKRAMLAHTSVAAAFAAARTPRRRQRTVRAL